jgi:hypothetical protein
VSSLVDVHGAIHAAGVSPSQAAPEIILKVDLYGQDSRSARICVIGRREDWIVYYRKIW